MGWEQSTLRNCKIRLLSRKCRKNVCRYYLVIIFVSHFYWLASCIFHNYFVLPPKHSSQKTASVQGSRFFILSYEHSYSAVMPMKILGHRLLQQCNTITQINRIIYRVRTGAGNPWKCLKLYEVFSRFEKCFNFGNGAWIWDTVLEIVNALLRFLD